MYYIDGAGNKQQIGASYFTGGADFGSQSVIVKMFGSWQMFIAILVVLILVIVGIVFLLRKKKKDDKKV